MGGIKGQSTLRERICKHCGAKFLGGPRAWYCPICRAARRRESDARLYREGCARHIGDTDKCVVCGKDYIINCGLQKYCPDCAPAAVAEKDRQQAMEWYSRNKGKYNPDRREKRRKLESVCMVCGRTFDPCGKPVKTCSPECDAERQRIHMQKADIRRGRRKSPVGVTYCSGLPNSGIVGVTARRNGKWQAKYKDKYLGVFDTIREAAERIDAEKEKSGTQPE